MPHFSLEKNFFFRNSTIKMVKLLHLGNKKMNLFCIALGFP